MRRVRLGRAATIAAVALMLSAQGAWADNLDLDGDGAEPVVGTALSFGEVCLGTTTPKSVIFQIHKTGSSHFASGATVAITIASATAGLSASGTSIVLPGDWNSLPNGTTRSGTQLATVTLSASVLGAFSGSVSYLASGPQNGGGTHSDANSISVSAMVVVCDTTPPTLNLPSPITVEATGPAGADVSFVASATDANPANPAVSCSPASGSTFPITTTTVTCSATDAADNTATGTFSVTVHDTTAPEIVGTPAAQSAEATGPSGTAITYTDPTATDIVDGTTPVACLPGSGATFALGPTTVTCTSTDGHANSASTTFVVTITDTTEPILIVPADIVAEATGPGGAAVAFSATATDIVDGSIAPDCDASSGDTFPLGLTLVTCTAEDAHGNTTSDSFSITVEDTTAPTVTVPASFSAEATGPSGAAVTFAASADDVVDGSIVPVCSPASGSTFALGPTTVTCLATDTAGNTGSASFVITVVDTTPPVLTLPADQLLEATGPSGAAATFIASASDLVDGVVTVTCSSSSGDTFPLGVTTVTCSAADVAGNLAAGSFSIQVVDTTPPALTVPGPIDAEATGPAGAPVSWSATALDIVDGPVTPVCTPASGATFALGATSVTCTATDLAGNSTSASFTVTVVDTTPPAITVPADITAEATGPSGASVSFVVSAADLVDGPVTPTCDAASGDTFPLGTTTVSCSAIDVAGNDSSASFDIAVVDTTAPAVSVPADITTGPTSISGAVVTYAGQSAADIVDGSLPLTCAPPSGSSFGFGVTTVTCSATDAAGNTGTNTFAITVNGFTFAGFYQPVDMVAVNTVKNGSTVPVKWEIFGAGGIEFTDTASVMSGWPKAAKVSCTNYVGLPEDVIETTATGGTSLRYDSTGGQFVYNWQTPKQAGTCWRLDVKLVDGTTKSATFKLK